MSPKSESFNKDIIVISVIWLVCATVIFIYKWESVSALNLNDNDDYMRFVQFQDWMATGHWYLEPMNNFNAADGIVIHWSRFPDLILSLVAFPLLFIVDDNLAYTISISLVPLLYLLLFSLSCFYLADHLFGAKYRFISMMFAISSPSIIHFLPGSIDHHNIQLVFAVLFLALTPLNHEQLRHAWRVYAQSILLSLSLWTGLDNVLLFMFFFAIYTVYCGLVRHEWFGYISKLYASSALFGICAVLLNRPYDEFFVFKYDEISFVLIILFFCGWLFVNVYHRFMNEDNSLLQKVFLFVFLAVLFLIPVAVLYPSLSSALLIDYPPILKVYWLDQVTEAKSVVRYVASHGFFSIENYALLVIPATLYPLFKRKNHHCTILYLIFMFNLALAIFWQIRVMRLCFVLAAPLQAYVILQLADYIRSSIIKATVITSGAPLAVAFVILALSPTEEITTTLDQKEQSLKIHKVLKDNDINSHTILSGIETGAPVLAKTDNRIIAAPYHRNIVGNQFLIEVMLEVDLSLAERKIIEKSIDIIVIGNDPHLLILKDSASEEAFINKLYSSDTPTWLDVVYDNIENGYRVFRVRESS
ncbi:conserved membrane hypothetical protein [Vibrio chagasii]|uniref:hypothetical protein n=1 Tax=Vibrio chagasii TaxID=170679 RepID=UPI001EFE51AE|nr:hypothetical protein [Vibrio chagasii]MCG9675486.1 hypothetical protein [Vibrio chagasii]CAH6950526.1 conserved membrane hypothetical protein [Vibrio chagasii]CAH6972149.1 conserved membrane hypothetical protein [Vibrio chagasii]CAH7014524.1 conserved membrane hypothetical protein [Vibrio chagasii]CAH7077364.1 conserved membrane hypothetical protein [Vibrio chagasii]